MGTQQLESVQRNAQHVREGKHGGIFLGKRSVADGRDLMRFDGYCGGEDDRTEM